MSFKPHHTDNQTLYLPIAVTYRKINGEMVMVDAEYADVPVDTLCQMIFRAFGVYNAICPRAEVSHAPM